VALAVAVVVVQGARDLARSAAADEPIGSAWLALALVPAAAALVVSGTLVTAAGPHSGGEEIVRFGNLVEAVHIHIGATAVFGVAFLALLGLLVVERRRARVELGLAAAVLALLLAQMVVGEIQWREALPWGLVLLHVSLATAVWVLVVVLAVRIVLRRRARLP
jgi:cytochrome c oxidase assembly protein subunit 15